MLGTQDPPPDFESLTVKRLGLRVLAFLLVGAGQIVCRVKSVRMVRTQDVALNSQSLAKKLLGLRVLALKFIQGAKAAHGSESLWILFAEHPAIDIQRALELSPCLGVYAEIHVGLRNGVSNGGFHSRLLGEFAFDSLGGAVERSADLEIGIGLRLVGGAGLAQQIVLQKVVYGLGNGSFPIGADALPDTYGCRSDEHQNEGGSSDEADPIASEELARAIANTRRVSGHRLIAQIVPDVGRQLQGRGVAAFAIFLKSLQRDGVCIAA